MHVCSFLFPQLALSAISYFSLGILTCRNSLLPFWFSILLNYSSALILLALSAPRKLQNWIALIRVVQQNTASQNMAGKYVLEWWDIPTIYRYTRWRRLIIREIQVQATGFKNRWPCWWLCRKWKVHHRRRFSVTGNLSEWENRFPSGNPVIVCNLSRGKALAKFATAQMCLWDNLLCPECSSLHSCTWRQKHQRSIPA